MGEDKDENVLNEHELTSNSLPLQSTSTIFESASNGNLDEVKQLVSNSCSGIQYDDVTSPVHCLNLLRDKKNSTPLHYAAGNGHVEVCRFLLHTVRLEATKCSNESAVSSYANLPNKTQGRTALHWAARNGHLEVCKLLVEDFGANPDPLAKGDVTPLQLAVWRGHVEVCLWLSEKGCADKHFMNGWGCTVHHWLAKSPIYAEALQERAQMENDANSDDSLTPVEKKLLTLCKWLDDEAENSSTHSLAWNKPNDHGQTPLHKAGFGGNLPVLKFLIETKGCCDDHRDAQHNTAADCAERNKQWETAKYLRRYGNPNCLQRASAVLFPESKDPPKIPSMVSLRSAYVKLARLYHPDRLIEGTSNHLQTMSDSIPENTATRMKQWKNLQEAYRLWTLWWKDPNEADTMIRGLERHYYLQRQLPLLLSWHEQWHDNHERNEKAAKKQKLGNCHEERPPSKQQFSDEALRKLEDFQTKLVRLLGTLPSNEIPLSQLPKEYEKTWGGTNSNGESAMIRPREYRCKKLRFLLEKYCSRTVEVVGRTKEERGGAATILMVRLIVR